MSVKLRQELERRIVTQAVKDLLAAGYSLNTDLGDGEELPHATNDEAIITKALFQGDEDRIYVYKGAKCVGWVFCVYGNDGWDVISDYTTNLETVLKAANAIADQYS